MPEQKISDILSTIHERREFEKTFGPIEPGPEPLAIMDRVTPLQPEDPIDTDEFTESMIEELSSSEKKKKRTQKKKRTKQ